MNEACCPVVLRRLVRDADAGVRSVSSNHKGIAAVLGGGRGCRLPLDAATAAIWIPLHGRVLIDAGRDGVLARGEVLVSEAERIHAVGRGNAVWVALHGRPAAWRSFMHASLGVPLADAWLFSARHAADLDLRRRASRLARAIESGEGVDVAAEDVVERIVALQAAFAAAIARCPGRTHAQRRQTFIRLQRVRNYLSGNCSLEIDNNALARMANYSPTHFIRAFRAAFGDTPHAFLVRQRLERARQLLRASPLAINEIALQSGFENASAFARVFRQRFGTTAGSVRRQYESLRIAPG